MTNLVVQTVFMRYNTSLTSSATVERLFSSARLIASCRRHSTLRDSTFEKLFDAKNKSVRMTTKTKKQGTYFVTILDALYVILIFDLENHLENSDSDFIFFSKMILRNTVNLQDHGVRNK